MSFSEIYGSWGARGNNVVLRPLRWFALSAVGVACFWLSVVVVCAFGPCPGPGLGNSFHRDPHLLGPPPLRAGRRPPFSTPLSPETSSLSKCGPSAAHEFDTQLHVHQHAMLGLGIAGTYGIYMCTRCGGGHVGRSWLKRRTTCHVTRTRVIYVYMRALSRIIPSSGDAR